MGMGDAMSRRLKLVIILMLLGMATVSAQEQTTKTPLTVPTITDEFGNGAPKRQPAEITPKTSLDDTWARADGSRKQPKEVAR
jgi:hypothetical protein